MNRNTDTDDWPTGYDRFQALMKKLEEGTTGMQTLTTKVEGLTMTVGELGTKIDDLNHTLTPKIDGLNTKIKDSLKAQGDLINKASCAKGLVSPTLADL
jgi:hypothetical protein